MIFWLENICFFIPYFLVYEALLIPLIYLRLVYNILKVETNKPFATLLSLVWLLVGPFYLFHGLLQDMYYYLKVLYEYNEDVTVGGEDEQSKEDKLQDKIVIYNELIDTMRAIMNIFKSKKASKLKKKKGAKSNDPKVPVHEQFNIRKETKESGAE